ncbi:hypothetical protein [Paenibacillus pedocola]|uniref:hypothetical protein n=1 Tax=Paenibacillus pedocola TaxID=3242193 RepID=UPI00287766F9|nr:hypothetical protein [Paenibacillus typhae]
MDNIVERQPVHNYTKRRFRNFLLILGLFLVALAVLNPTREDFSEFAADDLHDKLGDWLPGGATDMLARPLLNSIAERDNYILFSVYSIPDIKDGKTFISDIQAEKKYLGLFKRFFFEL